MNNWKEPIDGINLLCKIKNGEIKVGTKIKVYGENLRYKYIKLYEGNKLFFVNDSGQCVVLIPDILKCTFVLDGNNKNIKLQEPESITTWKFHGDMLSNDAHNFNVLAREIEINRNCIKEIVTFLNEKLDKIKED
jgi:hypothetical protein